MNKLMLSSVARFAQVQGMSGLIVNEHTLEPEEVVSHVDELSRWFEFIHLDQLPARVQQRGGKPFCLLTFDDGKKSNATSTAPILSRLGVPAVFYVVTDFLSRGYPLWFDCYTALLKVAPTAPPGLERETLKQLPQDELLSRLERAMQQYKVAPPQDSDHHRAMSWDEARKLSKEGFVIGAHSVRHTILTREAQTVACGEIRDSLAAVSSELGFPCRTFAFPNGNYNAVLAKCALESGATTVMTTDPTWVDRQTPLWRLPRIQLFGSSKPRMISMKVAAATVPGVLINPDGTGRLYRTIQRASRGRSL